MCPHCQRLIRASLPEYVTAPMHYGSVVEAVGAISVYLLQQQRLLYERAGATVQVNFGPSMKVRTLMELVNRCAQQLEAVEPVGF